MTITYAELSLYPFNQREQILQDWLTQFAWEVLNQEPKEDEPDER